MKLSQKELKAFPDDIGAMFIFAAEQGCTAVHVHLGDEKKVKKIENAMRETGLAVASVGAMSCAMLGPDREAQAHEHRQVERALAMADRLGAPTVSNFAGHNPTLDLAGNAEEFARVYEPHALLAERFGLKICFENAPMVGGQPRIARNIAYCPDHWQALFDACDSPALGIELDIAHCVYVGIDTVEVIRQWRHRIHHVHIKDSRINAGARAGRGVLEGIPHGLVPLGEGETDGEAVLRALADAGYNGYLTGDIEGHDIDAARRNLDALKSCAERAGIGLKLSA